MWWLIPLVAIAAMVGVPIYLAKRYFDLKERQLKSAGDREQEMARELAALRERVQVLEAIVVESDRELDRKLSKLELPAEATGGGAGEPTGGKR